MGLRKVWPRVVTAIEDTLPLYDTVNQIISLGRADDARLYGVRNAGLRDGAIVLDSGIGPGSLSKILLREIRPEKLVGLDYSTRLLREADNQLSQFRDNVDLVRGTFEKAPFRDEVFEGIFTAYALRDALDMEAALKEYARISRRGAPLVIIDIGKPSNRTKRLLMGVYIRFVMPLMAKAAIRGRIRGNPWRMIVPTYRHLPITSEILDMIARNYGPATVREFLQGGIAVITGRRMGVVRPHRSRSGRQTVRRRRRTGGRVRGR